MRGFGLLVTLGEVDVVWKTWLLLMSFFKRYKSQFSSLLSFFLTFCPFCFLCVSFLLRLLVHSFHLLLMLKKFLKGYYFTNVFTDCLVIQIIEVIKVILHGVVFCFLPPELELSNVLVSSFYAGQDWRRSNAAFGALLCFISPYNLQRWHGNFQTESCTWLPCLGWTLLYWDRCVVGKSRKWGPHYL